MHGPGEGDGLASVAAPFPAATLPRRPAVSHAGDCLPPPCADDRAVRGLDAAAGSRSPTGTNTACAPTQNAIASEPIAPAAAAPCLGAATHSVVSPSLARPLHPAASVTHTKNEAKRQAVNEKEPANQNISASAPRESSPLSPLSRDNSWLVPRLSAPHLRTSSFPARRPQTAPACGPPANSCRFRSRPPRSRSSTCRQEIRSSLTPTNATVGSLFTNVAGQTRVFTSVAGQIQVTVPNTWTLPNHSIEVEHGRAVGR